MRIVFPICFFLIIVSTALAQEDAVEEKKETMAAFPGEDIGFGMSLRTILYLHEKIRNPSETLPVDVMLGILLKGGTGRPVGFYYQTTILMPLVKSDIYFYNEKADRGTKWAHADPTRTGFSFDLTLGGRWKTDMGNNARFLLAGGIHIGYIGHYSGDIAVLSLRSLNFFYIGLSGSTEVLIPISRRTSLQIALFTSLDTGLNIHRESLGAIPFMMQPELSVTFGFQ